METRKLTRLKGYDYSADGHYFITICTAEKQKIFGTIVGQGLAPAEIKLSALGKIADQQLKDIPKRFTNITVDKYVIMPNHIHAIIRIEKAAGASPCPTLSDVVCAYKSLTTKNCKKYFNESIWQKSFYDHIIRDERDYLRIAEYIENNPAKWMEDKYYDE